MAFVSMIFAFLAIVLIILGVMFIAGLLFLIPGIVNARKPKYAGKKSPVVFIVIGTLLIALPVGTALTLLVVGVSNSVSTNIRRMGYDNVTDKWRSEWVSDHTAAEDAIEELLSSADAGDRERFAKTFTPNIQQSENFDAALDDFFAAYPVGLSRCELDGGNVGSSGSYNYGHNVQTGGTHYTCVLDGEWYHIIMEFCYENTDFPDDVGVTFFAVENLEANALDIDYKDKQLVCNIKSDSEVSARLIGGDAFLFEPYPDRVITEEEMIAYLAEYDDLYDLSREIGEPNVTKKYSNCTGYDHYYELAPENGEPRYAYICTNSPTGRFLNGYICSDTIGFYDRTLFPDK
ncbi:MAG: DUF5104 domain-containing protein [Oscillospiraceae bacterium]|nr:DUF5104 domain-containing protein [Oscillospiraceae bacterium]